MKTYKITLVMCAVLLFFGAAYGQGEQLFKAKCNTCHMVDKASIGPVLKGVKQKWNDAGEGELLYKWVENSVALINGGQSKMALAIKGFSGSEMSPQQVTPAEVDAILDYVDNYVVPPPPPPVINGSETDPNVTLVPDYEGNLTMFYWLITFMVILLFAIIIMSNTIIGFVKSDLFKNKLREQNDQKEGKNLLGIILLIVAIGSMFTSNTSYALEFVNAGDTTENTPWLLVERSDLYILLTLDLLMVAVVLYLKNLFNTFLYMVVPRKEKVKPERVKKIKHVLTDVVPIEDEASILMDHDYDGIQELDNNLPPWWVWGFYTTILFAVIYLFNYHFFRTGDLQEAEYKKEVATAQKEIDAYLDKMAMNVDETNATLLTEEADISAGKGLFQNNCIACHKEGGQGDIGPNLTDNFWIYGKDIKEVFGTIKNGTANGMPEHASKLNPIQLQQVASFVLQLKFKAGKEPQGTEVK